MGGGVGGGERKVEFSPFALPITLIYSVKVWKLDSCGGDGGETRDYFGHDSGK